MNTTRTAGTRPAAGVRSAGVGTLTRLALRRDRVWLPAWLVGVAAFVAYVSGAYQVMFASRAELNSVLTMVSGPVGRLITGPGYGLDDTVTYAGFFAGVYWLYLLIVVGVLNVLLVPRHTRAEEESGRAELVAAGAVSRLASLRAAARVAVLTNTLVALVTGGLVWVFAGQGPEGLSTPASQVPESAVLLGLATGAFGLVVAAVAAVTSQLATSHRAAAGLAGLVLGVAFGLRSVGDMAEPGGSWASWLSPFGWAQQTAPFVEPSWWPLLIPLVVSLALGVLAVALRQRRDLGAGLLTARPGRAHASPWLRHSLGLAARLHRGGLIAWTAGLVAFAVVYGAVTSLVVESLPALPPEFATMFGTDAAAPRQLLADAYLELMLVLFSVFVAVAALVLLSSVRAEELSGRAVGVLATPLGRGRWYAEHLAVIALGTAAAALLTGATFAAVSAATGTDVFIDVGAVVAATAATVPAVWLVLGVGALGYGLAPRLLGLAWIPVLVGFFLETFGSLMDLPDAVKQLSPWHHTPRLLSEGLALTSADALVPLAAQAAVALVLLVAGVRFLRRRDLHTG